MITLTEQELTFLQSNLKTTRTARVGDYLVEIDFQRLCEDRYAEPPERLRYTYNCFYTLRRITRKTQSSLYTRGRPYVRWSYLSSAGNTLETVYPPWMERQLASSFLEEHTVRDLRDLILRFRDVGDENTLAFREIQSTKCRQFDLGSHSHPRGCEIYPKVYYTRGDPDEGGFCKNCWDDLKEHL